MVSNKTNVSKTTAITLAQFTPKETDKNKKLIKFY